MKKNLFAFILLTFLASGLHAQQQHLDSIVRKFNRYRERTLQEKLFVHIDQDAYLTGEILWFKIYALDASFHLPVSVSKIAYLEVLDRSDKPVLQTKVTLTSKGGQGSLFIPATLASGNYMVRVYTQWMRNFSPEFFFHKNITIVNPFVRPELEKSRSVSKIHVAFFPEGGNLVAGLRSKVAFQMTDNFGKPLSRRGVIVDNNDDTVTAFQPGKFGLGHFYLTPRPGANYRCIVTDADNKTTAHVLPAAFTQGFVMHVSDSTPELLKVKVQHKATDSNSLIYVYLFAHSRNLTVHAEAKPIYPRAATFLIDKAKLPPGITHLTIFNEERLPLCERLVFKQPSEKLTVNVSSDQSQFTTRRKVLIELNASAKGQPVQAKFSVSVYKVDSVFNSKPQDFLSYLYLSSDLRGHVESPEYYFSNDPEISRAADDLMLTHGWRRFDWQQVFKKKSAFNFIPEYRNHLITGKVTRNDGTPVAGVLTYLASPGKLINVYAARSNEQGGVHFEVSDFIGSRRLVLQTNTTKDSTYTLSINNPFSTDYATRMLPDFIISPSAEEVLRSRSISMQVQDVYYREQTDRITVSKNDSTAFYGKADETYFLDDFTRFPVLEEVMREYVPGVLVRKRKDGFHFIVLDQVNTGVLSGDPLVMIDGVPVFDVDDIMAFDPLRIKKLEVVKRNFYIGPLSIPGIVSYSTYQGDLAGFNIDPRSVVVNYEGLQLQREFYAPKYDNQKQRNNRMPDQRTLLFWSPEVRTGGNGKHLIEFFTSDVTGSYQVVIQGITDNGLPGTGTYNFSVKRNDF